MNVWLHIGPQKTGSTSIQKSLENLENPKFSYLSFGNFEKELTNKTFNHSKPMRFIFDDEFFIRHSKWKSFSKESSEKLRKNLKKNLTNEISRKDKQHIIISGEGLGTCNAKTVKKMKDFFADHSCNLKIIFYHRDAIDKIKSRFQQRLKNRIFSIDELDYKSVSSYLLNYLKYFNKKQIIIRGFGKKELANGCVVQDFCQLIGLKINVNDVIRANTSMSLHSAKVLYIYNKYLLNEKNIKGKRKDRYKLQNFITEAYTGSQKIDTNLFKFICKDEDLINDNKFLAEKFDFHKRNKGIIEKFVSVFKSFKLINPSVSITNFNELDLFFSDPSDINNAPLDDFLIQKGVEKNRFHEVSLEKKVGLVHEVLCNHKL
tara:strand:+ start:9296 stop:10417 length:1122 start_codon:yes stop_codon:yes gene_type:complete